MRSLVLFALVASATAKGVVHAGDSDFDKKVIGSGKNALVKFLAPW